MTNAKNNLYAWGGLTPNAKDINNLYFWYDLYSLSSEPYTYLFALAPNKEQAITNAIEALTVQWAFKKGKGLSPWTKEPYPDLLSEDIAKVEKELNAKEPKVNELIYIIKHD